MPPRLRLAAALGLAACGVHQPQIGAPLPGATEAPAPPAPPPADPERGCVADRDAALRFVAEYGVYLREAEHAHAAAQGWQPLGPPQVARPVGHSSRPGHDFMIGDRHLRRADARRLVDEHGAWWHAVGRTGACVGGPGPFYLDRANPVFEVAARPDCPERATIAVCGILPGAGGCGTSPDPDDRLDWYVPAPREARLPSKVDLAYPVPRCFDIEPTEGYDHPP
jgi:hypothetical protein